MNTQQTVELLKQKVVKIVFEKTNGEHRQMNATLDPQHLPEVEKDTKDKPKREPNPEVQVIFDVDKKAWRSFRWDRLKTVDNNQYQTEKK